ncbi:MAG TPA: PPOX class F420-dependent oxidoreductase [Acidimicrobiales bacterium]|jgi:pyridoxamine 5'-phosphate oxidase family protein
MRLSATAHDEEVGMSAFTTAEIEYLRSQTMGRLATVGRDGRPHVVPLTYVFNADEDAIDLGGIDFGAGKKWRDAQGNPNITFLVDDFAPTEAHAVEIRGDAELHETGGEAINPRFPNFVPQFIRLRPRHIVSWGLDAGTGMTDGGFGVNSRAVG